MLVLPAREFVLSERNCGCGRRILSGGKRADFSLYQTCATHSLRTPQKLGS
jgi:hypothetical protein